MAQGSEREALDVELAASDARAAQARPDRRDHPGRTTEVHVAFGEVGHELAQVIHSSGQAIVFSGQQETAEHYWEQLKGAGLTMAPLEQG